jgi:hypothetical protein
MNIYNTKMFESRNKFRGIIRNKMTELNTLKGRKKMPTKRYLSVYSDSLRLPCVKQVL